MDKAAPAESPAELLTRAYDHQPADATAALVLADGTVFWGRGLGATATTTGEVCFNTSMTGYQEIMTDPSYAGQLITFTFPHIGNVGTTPEDIETMTPVARGAIVRQALTEPSNWRAEQHLGAWLASHGLPGISGVDTRALTHRIRDAGAPHGTLAHAPDGRFELEALRSAAAGWPGLAGMDLAGEVSCLQAYTWDETRWTLGEGYGRLESPRHKVVAIDYGAKRNILRCLASAGCAVTVVPASATAEEILAHEPDGV
ncbi:MAG: carbamoyl-phosphate synthase domain-containing protein, partial [Tistlia sp.]